MNHDIRCAVHVAHSEHECSSKQYAGVLVRTDGTYETLQVEALELEGLQDLIGGDIEAYPQSQMPFPITMFMAEDAEGMRLNGMGVTITGRENVRGPIILAGLADADGETLPIPLIFWNYVTAMCVLFAEGRRAAREEAVA